MTRQIDTSDNGAIRIQGERAPQPYVRAFSSREAMESRRRALLRTIEIMQEELADIDAALQHLDGRR